AWPWLFPALAGAAALPLAVQGFRRAFAADTAFFGARELVFLVGFPLYALFVGNNLLLSSGDNTATRNFGFVLTHGTLDFGALPENQGGHLHYAFVHAGGRVLPVFPIGTPILALPHSLLAFLAQGARYEGLALFRDEKH